MWTRETRWRRLVKIGTVAVLSGLSSTAFAQGPTGRADFNGDGFDDLAIGAPVSSGRVSIVYGSATRLATGTTQTFSQNSAGISGGVELDDNCGASLATGDFDGDGFSDLALGCPGETLNGVERMGVVIVLYGRPTGLSGTGSQFWHQNSSNVNGGGETDDRCGTALAAGDFNGDGRADLAWGCPGEAVGSKSGSGAVNILFGSPTGLTSAGSRFLSQDTASVADAAEANDHCGQALTAADFNSDGRDDLAMGCPGEDLGPLGALFDAGGVTVLFGSSSGLTGSGSIFLTQDHGGAVSDGVEAFDQCGAALGAGHVNGDGFADLVMGCPGEDFLIVVVGGNDLGTAHLFYGFTGGFAQGGLLGLIGSGKCGAAVAAGDFNDDGLADIASGCPSEDDGRGLVQIFPGAGTFGGTVLPIQGWTQDTTGVADVAGRGDAFGTAVATGDYNGDGFADLAIGVPHDDPGSGTASAGAGGVNVLYGSASGLTAVGDQFIAGTIRFAALGFAFPGSGGTASPGLTGTWEDVRQTCHGNDDDTDRCSLRGTFTAINPSTQSTPKVTLRFFLSADQTLDDDDVVIDGARLKALQVGQTQQRRLHVRLPRGVDATGQFVIAFVDADNVVMETNEQNNIVPFGPIQ